jgi:multiple sugar transport system substrate-binding protein
VLYLVANPKILQEYGITPPPMERPWTWDEFKAVLRKLNAPRPGGERVYPFNAPAQGSIFEWSPLLFAHCGPVFIEGQSAAPDGTLPLAPHLDQALGEVAGLVREGLTAPSFGTDDQQEAWAGFLAGRTALLMTSPAFLKTLVQKNVPHVILPPPMGKLGQPITTGAVGCLAVVASGVPERVKAAHTLARWLTSAEIAQSVPGWYLAPPARASVTSFYDQPAYRPLRALMPTARYMMPPVSAGFMESILIPKLAAAALGQATPEAAIKEIQDAARDRALR